MTGNNRWGDEPFLYGIQADDEIIQRVLGSQDERNLRVYQIPLSIIKVNGSKINYYDFIYSLQNRDCNMALKRIHPKIDMTKINHIIDETPYISGLQKQFYKAMLRERKEKIPDVSLQKLQKCELSGETAMN